MFLIHPFVRVLGRVYSQCDSGMLVGCKADSAQSDAVLVSAEHGAEVAAAHGLTHVHCSASEGRDCDTPFNYVANVFHRMYEARVKSV